MDDSEVETDGTQSQSIGLVRKTKTKWTLKLERSNFEGIRLNFLNVTDRQVKISGQYSSGGVWYDFSESYLIPQGFVCTTCVNTSDKFLVEAQSAKLTGDEFHQQTDVTDDEGEVETEQSLTSTSAENDDNDDTDETS